jgi:hypothetical protein
MSDTLKMLAAALQAEGLISTVNPSRVVSSSQYDLHYQLTIIGLILQTCGKKRKMETGEYLVLNLMVLRLYNFLALRPTLIPEFERCYAETSGYVISDLEDWCSFPRGYLTDKPNIDVLSFLRAYGEISLKGKDILFNVENSKLIRPLLDSARLNKLFTGERAAIAHLAKLKLKLNELGF